MQLQRLIEGGFRSGRQGEVGDKKLEAAIADALPKRLYQRRVELGARALAHPVESPQGLQTFAAAPCRQRLVHLGDSDDPSAQWNLLPDQSVRLAASVPALVMTAHVSQDIGGELRSPQDFLSRFSVSWDLETLTCCERHVPDVVKESCRPQVLEPGHRQG